MARLAMRVKEVKRKTLAKKYGAKRTELREAAVNMKLSEDERQEARTKDLAVLLFSPALSINAVRLSPEQ